MKKFCNQDGMVNHLFVSIISYFDFKVQSRSHFRRLKQAGLQIFIFSSQQAIQAFQTRNPVDPDLLVTDLEGNFVRFGKRSLANKLNNFAQVLLLLKDLLDLKMTRGKFTWKAIRVFSTIDFYNFALVATNIREILCDCQNAGNKFSNILNLQISRMHFYPASLNSTNSTDGLQNSSNILTPIFQCYSAIFGSFVRCQALNEALQTFVLNPINSGKFFS